VLTLPPEATLLYTYYGMRGSCGHHPSGCGFSSGNSMPFRGRGRGHPYGRGSSSNRPLCQVCNRYGHVALDCYNRFNEAYTREQPSQAHAYLSAPSSSIDQNWYPDSGATHHLTSDLANLNIKAEDYLGSDQIRIGNGKGLSIKHIGTTRLSTPISHFDLHDILHVPHITKKSHLCSEIHHGH
jgi:hypothetical protein